MGGSVKVGTEERMKVRVRLPCCQLLQISKGKRKKSRAVIHDD